VTLIIVRRFIFCSKNFKKIISKNLEKCRIP
jgi:hypothetical protein